jgi:hypothetical protein
LIAWSLSSNRPAGLRGVFGFTSTASIYVMHVDRPERHSQLSGGHDHDIFHLSWGPSQMGTILLSADSRNCLCLWKPVQGLINRWQLHHRLVLPAVALVQWLSQGPIYSLPEPHFKGNPIPAPPAPSMAAKASYEARYRRDLTPKRSDPAAANPTPVAGKAPDLVFRSPSGCLCIFALTRYGEARVFLELSAGTSGVFAECSPLLWHPKAWVVAVPEVAVLVGVCCS